MNQIIQWCNANQGFLSGCLTLVYVVATIWLVILSRRQIGVLLVLERNRTRPFAVFDMVFERYHLYAKVTNMGQTVALNVKIDVQPKLQHVYGGEAAFPRDERTKSLPFIDRGIPTLSPGREIKALVGFSARVHSAYPDMRFGGTISYSDRAGQFYSEPFIIDAVALEAHAYRVSKDIEDVAKQLEEIARTLASVASGSSKPLVRTVTEKEYAAQEEAFVAEMMAGQDSSPRSSANPAEDHPPA